MNFYNAISNEAGKPNTVSDTCYYNFTNPTIKFNQTITIAQNNDDSYTLKIAGVEAFSIPYLVGYNLAGFYISEVGGDFTTIPTYSTENIYFPWKEFFDTFNYLLKNDKSLNLILKILLIFE